MWTSRQRLPTAGETVLIKGLVSSPALNEKRCKIVRYLEKSHRYSVKLRSDGTIRKVEIKPQNISLLPSKKTDAGSSIRGNDAYYFCGDWDVAHFFVPCHVEDERRCEQFEQCCKSMIHQNGSCRIFVGVSGPAEMRQLAIASLRKAAVSSGSADRVGRHQWIVLEVTGDADESNYTKKSQFQHYESLLEVSMLIKPAAHIMFLDNDDMYHPDRVKYFQDIISRRRQKKNKFESAFYCGGKLLIDTVKANAKFGGVIKLDQFLSKDDKLNGLVDVAASAKENDEKDVQEYFDFCVRSEVLQRFMDVTPDGILSRRFCDVRFSSSLSHPKIATYEHPQQEWLMMHYRMRHSDRHKRFLALDSETYNM